jgi:hypothetical protein
MQNEKTTHKVGYKNPPKTKRFIKGQSGNPKGRPKSSKNLKTLIEKEISETVVITENGVRKKLTKAEIISKSIVNAAMKLNPKALDALLLQWEKISDQEEERESRKNKKITEKSDLEIINRVHGKKRKK